MSEKRRWPHWTSIPVPAINLTRESSTKDAKKTMKEIDAKLDKVNKMFPITAITYHFTPEGAVDHISVMTRDFAVTFDVVTPFLDLGPKEEDC